MVKKILIGVAAVLVIVGACFTTWFFTNRSAQKDLEELAAEKASVQAQIDAMGLPVVRYTPRVTIEPGTQITADMLQEMNIPDKWITDDYCTLEEIIGAPVEKDAEGNPITYSGQFAKTYINPGTPITKSLLMKEPIADSLREIDVVANRWPIGLKVGDYVDIRITYPLGEDFIVLTHKRVYEVNEQTLKLHMTEEEQHIYQAALVDYYLHAEAGMDIYFNKYVEPGVQDAATPYYSVPHNIATVCLSDPNIVDHAMVTVKEGLLGIQQGADNPFPEDSDQPGFIRSGRDRLNSAVNSDYSAWKNEYEKEQQEQQQQGGSGDNGSLIDSGGVG